MRKLSTNWKQVNGNACHPYGDRDARPARQRLSSPSAFPVLPLTEHSSCHKPSGRWFGVLVLHGRIGGHSFKVNLCTQIFSFFKYSGMKIEDSGELEQLQKQMKRELLVT